MRSGLGVDFIASVVQDSEASQQLVPEHMPQHAANASLQCTVSSLRLMLVPEVAMHSLAFIERARLAWVVASFLFPRVHESLQPSKRVTNRSKGDGQALESSDSADDSDQGKGAAVGAGSSGSAESSEDGIYEDEEERKSEESGSGDDLDVGDGQRHGRGGAASIGQSRGRVQAVQLRIRPAVNLWVERLTVVATEYRDKAEEATASRSSVDEEDDGSLATDQPGSVGGVRLGQGLSALQIDLKGMSMRTAGAA